MLTVATANVNGIRAAARRGMTAWLAASDPIDVLCLQEVRAPDDVLREFVGDGWHVVHQEGEVAGRAGVAVLTRTSPDAVRMGLGEEFAKGGRWVEADLPCAVSDSHTGADAGRLTVISTYVHTGEADTPRQHEKHRFLDAALARMTELRDAGAEVLVCGDLNVAHREVDLKNWKGNLKKSGFLPAERAWFDALFDDHGWVDVHRALAGEGPGPYTWWSWRGKAFDTDAGWRIDYQIASPTLAAAARSASVGRAATYAERWSDHAPVIITYDLPSVGATHHGN